MGKREYGSENDTGTKSGSNCEKEFLTKQTDMEHDEETDIPSVAVRSSVILSLVGAIACFVVSALLSVAFFLSNVDGDFLWPSVGKTTLTLMHLVLIIIYGRLIRESKVRQRRKLAVAGIVLSCFTLIPAVSQYFLEIGLCCIVAIDIATEIILIVGSIKTIVAVYGNDKK